MKTQSLIQYLTIGLLILFVLITQAVASNASGPAID